MIISVINYLFLVVVVVLLLLVVVVVPHTRVETLPV